MWRRDWVVCCCVACYNLGVVYFLFSDLHLALEFVGCAKLVRDDTVYIRPDLLFSVTFPHDIFCCIGYDMEDVPI